MGMFCNQCQETARNKGCEFGGVCGKSEELADLQDLLIYTLKGISEIVVKGRLEVDEIKAVNHQVAESLFMTITNANFDDAVIIDKIRKMLSLRNELRHMTAADGLSDAATFEITSASDLIYKASYAGLFPKDHEDARSLKQLITFGLKGLAAYICHALKLGMESTELYSHIYQALAATLETGIAVEELFLLAMKTGEMGVSAMALLDKANTGRYGNPEITEVSISVGKKPAILVSGHDLSDLEQLLEQTRGTGVDVYTHCEMLPAHYYPGFKKYDNLAGNYGNAWWQQEKEFETFNGPVLFTTNCIVPPISEAVRSRLFTTGASGLPGCIHIKADKYGHKDFTPVIELARKSKAPQQIESGRLVGGFAHAQVLALSHKIVEAVKSGAIKKFIVMAGCDGRMESREYYSDFAGRLPKDAVILTAGCAKYRYNKLELGDAGGIPRVLDAGQCNDSYSLVLIALKLKEIFGQEDINELPIAFNISWYEQKAVLVLLSLLYLGVRNIHLGPTLPAFLSQNVAGILGEKFGIAGIGTVEEDIRLFMEV